jgi:hypothetical protein
MFRKKVWAATVAALLMGVMLAGVPAALADGGGQLAQVYDSDSGAWVTCIADGRINGCQLDEPVAIYYTSASEPVLDTYGQITWNSDGSQAYTDAVAGIEMWGMASGYDNLIKVISLSADEIQAEIAANGGADTVLAQGYGYTLGYSATGYFWVTAPDGYSFVWEGASLLG